MFSVYGEKPDRLILCGGEAIGVEVDGKFELVGGMDDCDPMPEDPSLQVRSGGAAGKTLEQEMQEYRENLAEWYRCKGRSAMLASPALAELFEPKIQTAFRSPQVSRSLLEAMPWETRKKISKTSSLLQQVVRRHETEMRTGLRSFDLGYMLRLPMARTSLFRQLKRPDVNNLAGMPGEVGAFAGLEKDILDRQSLSKWNPPPGLPLGFQFKLKIIKNAEDNRAFWGIGLTSRPRQTTNPIRGELMKVTFANYLLPPYVYPGAFHPFGFHDAQDYDESALYFATPESFPLKYHYLQMFLGEPQYLVGDFAVWTNVPLEGKEIRIRNDQLEIQ